ncbi:helix-turn-helix transcriptional regulator [Sphingobium sp.]|uniref:helix-turn-helix transcriptional regulator n=1 Tax=Sphingobium sp. TaxID=1912891 RepID=UPI003B3A27EE
MSFDPDFAFSRRAFAIGMTGSLAALGVAEDAAADNPAQSAGVQASTDPAFRDAALRGLARSGDIGDPILSAKMEAAIARLEASHPEDAALVRIYRLYDTPPADPYYGRRAIDDDATARLALLHAAIAQCRAISFRYTDRAGQATLRTTLPLALVHPPQGIKLLAWCEKRKDYRQFFAHRLDELTLTNGQFSARRLPLLRGLVGSATDRA